MGYFTPLADHGIKSAQDQRGREKILHGGRRSRIDLGYPSPLILDFTGLTFMVIKGTASCPDAGLFASSISFENTAVLFTGLTSIRHFGKHSDRYGYALSTNGVTGAKENTISLLYIGVKELHLVLNGYWLRQRIATLAL